MAEHRDYIVLYEEPDEGQLPGDDVAINIDLEALPEQQVVAEFSGEVSNHVSWVATLGLVLTIIGAIVALASAVFFSIFYPEAWWPDADRTLSGFEVDPVITRIAMGLTFATFGLLVIGNLFVGFGRNLHARGTLHRVRFIPVERD